MKFATIGAAVGATIGLAAAIGLRKSKFLALDLGTIGAIGGAIKGDGGFKGIKKRKQLEQRETNISTQLRAIKNSRARR